MWLFFTATVSAFARSFSTTQSDGEATDADVREAVTEAESNAERAAQQVAADGGAVTADETKPEEKYPEIENGVACLKPDSRFVFTPAEDVTLHEFSNRVVPGFEGQTWIVAEGEDVIDDVEGWA